MRNWLLTVVAVCLLAGSTGCLLPGYSADPARRAQQLIYTSENLRQMRLSSTIVDTLVEDKRIELRNFGVFEVKQRAARKARNPRTGEKVFVPEKFVVTFKPGKEMEERVRELERRAAEQAAAARLASNSQPPPTQQPSASHDQNYSPATSYESSSGG